MIVLEVAFSVPLNKTFYYLPVDNLSPENTVGKRIATGYALSVVD